MPLASFAFTGWVSGHSPSAPGSTNAAASGAAGGGGATSALALGAAAGRGTGGNGNGAPSPSTPLDSRTLVFQARQPAYAIPATMPAPSNRFVPLRIGEFSHVGPTGGRGRSRSQAIGRWLPARQCG